MRSLFAAAVAVIIAVVAAQLPPAPMETVWEGMFTPPYIETPSIILTMACVTNDSCYVGGGSNGVGFGVYKYGGGMNGALTRMMEPNMSMFIIDIAVGGTKAEPHGAFASIVDFTFGKGLQYLANKGTEWLPSIMPLEIVWASESIVADPAGKNLYAAGTGFSNDIMSSTDYGVSFKSTPMSYSSGDRCDGPGSLVTPSADAWFMTWGAQPEQNNNNNDGKVRHHRVNSKYLNAGEAIVGKKNNGRVLVIRHAPTGKIRVHTKSLREASADRLEAMNDKDNKCNYYNGSIIKSTDGGKTWRSVFHMPHAEVMYIKCSSATHCVGVAFNANYSYIVTSVDGVNFKITHTTPPMTSTYAVDISVIEYASDTEVWAGGAQESTSGTSGMFWSSTNMGISWTVYPHVIPDVAALMTIDFVNGVGFAAGMTMFKTAQIMRYKKQADYGSFIQAHCPFAGCSFLCQNVTFPQGRCLAAQGGSVQALCTPTGLNQYVYETTSCVGSYKTDTQPINQCINGTQNYFENYCPPTGGSVSGPSRPAGPSEKLWR